MFPLPNLVLFPSVVQPLHVFEPRYRQLMADALTGDRLITMALLKPGWEHNYQNRPPIHPVVCIGRIHKEELLPDGRYNLLLQGLRRARIVEELAPDRLYRKARVELIQGVPVPSQENERELRRQLGEHMSQWFASKPSSRAQMESLLNSSLRLETLCDIFSFALPLDCELKQELLNAEHVEHRVRHLLMLLQSDGAKEHGKNERARFPPDFSAN